MTDSTERAQVGWGFWLWWVLASAVGLAVLGLMGWDVGGAVAEAEGGAVGIAVGFAVRGAVAGASVGTAQWLVLRRQVSPAGWWVLASTVGYAVAFAVLVPVFGAEAVPEAVGEVVGFSVRGAVAGASVGIAQWLVLRRQVSRAGWWGLASYVGFSVTLVVGLGLTVGVGWALTFAVGGAVGGAITGGVMVWLLRQTVTEEPSLPQDAG